MISSMERAHSRLEQDLLTAVHALDRRRESSPEALEAPAGPARESAHRWARTASAVDGIVAGSAQLAAARPRARRIFDTFPFDGELMMLVHRLDEVYEHVDGIILVEAGMTYRGRPKELTFAKHRARLAWANAKLRYVQLASLGPERSQPRERAAIQRNAIMLALRDLVPDDIVLLLDVDEIPNVSTLNRLRAEGLATAGRLSMTRHYQHVNALAPASACCAQHAETHIPAPAASWQQLHPLWYGQSGVAVPGFLLLGDSARQLAPVSPFALRFGDATAPPIADAGRHLSSVDPSTRLEDKLERVFHSEWAGTRATRAAHLHRCRKHGVHHRGWWSVTIPAGPLPEDLRRIAGRLPSVMLGTLPPNWQRHCVQAWARWRTWPMLPEWLVAAVDEHFWIMLPLLFVLWPVMAVRGRLVRYARSLSRKPSSAAVSRNSPRSS